MILAIQEIFPALSILELFAIDGQIRYGNSVLDTELIKTFELKILNVCCKRRLVSCKSMRQVQTCLCQIAFGLMLIDREGDP